MELLFIKPGIKPESQSPSGAEYTPRMVDFQGLYLMGNNVTYGLSAYHYCTSIGDMFHYWSKDWVEVVNDEHLKKLDPATFLIKLLRNTSLRLVYDHDQEPPFVWDVVPCNEDTSVYLDGLIRNYGRDALIYRLLQLLRSER